MTEQRALDIATGFLDALTAKDIGRAGDYLAKDFTFDGPMAHYGSAAAFLSEAGSFVATIAPGWKKIAAFGDERETLLLYDLTLSSGAAWRIADHYTVREGKIQTETILWDTCGLR
jgi:hypothetical protein